MLPVSLGPTGSGSGMGSSAKVAFTSTFLSGMVKVTLVGSSASGFRKVGSCSTPFTFTVQLMKDDADNNKFHPAFPVSKLRTCLTWNAAKEKGLFDKTEE